MNWMPIILSLQLALVTTLILIFVSLPISSWLSTTQSRLKPFIESLVALPLVLPPTVLGFYMLMAFSPGNQFGKWIEHVFGLQFVFSFPGLVLASVLYSLPFMVHPIQSGLSGLSPSLKEASYVLGKSRLKTFFSVLLPNIRHSVITGIVLSFAHTIGEFGVVLMIGGNIPGQTRVASIAIYDEVEALNYEAAHIYSLILIAFCFAILLVVYSLNGGNLKRVLK